MKKRMKKLVILGVTAVFMAGMVSGCGKKATPENLLDDMSKNMEDVESVLYNMYFVMNLNDGNNTVSVEMNLDLEESFASNTSHGKGNIGLWMGENSLQSEMEMYTELRDDQYVVYSGIDGNWTSQTVDDEVYGDFDVLTDALDPDDFTLDEELSDVNGKECFRLNGEIDGEYISELMQEDVIDSITGDEFGDDYIQDLTLPCTIDIYKDTILPAKVYIDMLDAADSGMEESIFTDYYIELTYQEYDSVDQITIPTDVIDAAEGGTSNQENSESSVKPAPSAEADDQLGTDWRTYKVQINDKLITLPCKKEDIEDAGLKMDTEYTPEDYVVNAGEYELAWFQDSFGNELEVYFINDSDKAKEIKDCMVSGLSVYSYDIEDGNLSVMFPGGVQVGSSPDDVIKLYGEPADKYESEDYGNSYYWYDGDSYFNQFYISVEKESGLVDSASVQMLDKIYQ